MMNRVAAAVLLLVAAAMPAHAQGIGDFDCYSDLNGPDTPAGLLRIDEPTSFAFLNPATATPGPSYPMDMVTDEIVNFDDAFANHISPGAIMVEASWFESSFSYEAAILTSGGKVVLVSCPYIP